VKKAERGSTERSVDSRSVDWGGANRLRTIYEKLHVSNRTQAALYALRQGWAALDEPPG